MIGEKRIPLSVLIFTIAYVVGFLIYYITVQNYEFLWYLVIISVLIYIMIKLYKKYNLSNSVLIGISAWGLMHLLGGSLMIGGKRLYANMIWDLGIESFAGTPILKFDQFLHFYFYVVVTILLVYIMRPYLKKGYNKFVVSVLLVFTAMGVGALNEIFELLPVLFLETQGVGDYFNTMWDIVFNTFGAIVAVVYLNLKGKI